MIAVSVRLLGASSYRIIRLRLRQMKTYRRIAIVVVGMELSMSWIFRIWWLKLKSHKTKMVGFDLARKRFKLANP